MARTVEFVMGLLGGIFGFFASIFALMIGGVGSAFGLNDASIVILGGWTSMALSLIGVLGAALVKSKTKLGGWLMLISAVGGVLSISLGYVLSFVLLLIAGLMALLKKEEKK